MVSLGDERPISSDGAVSTAPPNEGEAQTVEPDVQLSQDIRSVHVPIVNPASDCRFLEYELIEAVQKQIQQRAHFRLVNEDDADTQLAVRIIDPGKSTARPTRKRDASELQINLIVEVTWKDVPAGHILAEHRVPLPPGIVQVVAQAKLAPEGFPSPGLTTGDRTAIDGLARNIVDVIETPW
jgi:hypothetical protein